MALCFTGWGQMSDSVVVPLANAIYGEFPDSSLFLSNFVLTGSCLFAVPSALLSGVLTKYIGKKKLLIASVIMFMIGGFGGYFSTSMEFLAFTRALDGASDGISVTLIASLIAELFADEKLRSNVYGWNAAISALFGIVMALFAGWACITIGWRYAFLIHVIDFITLFMIICFLPDLPVKERTNSHGFTLYTQKDAMHRIVRQLLFYLILCTLTSLIYYTVDLYVSETGIGNALLSGELSSVSTIGMFIVDVIFGTLYMKTRKYLPVLFSIAMAVNFALLAFVPVKESAFLAMAVYSFAVACQGPYFQMQIAKDSDSRDTAFYMGLYYGIAYLCGFICPYLMTFIGLISGNYTVRFTFLICTVVEVIFVIGYLLGAVRSKEAKKTSK